MKFIFSKLFALSALLLTLASAETLSLPKSTQVGTSHKSSPIEVIPEIKIETGTSSKNSNLKEGEACNDDDLEPAVLGPDMIELPMAKTEPCADVDCKNLKPAKLSKDNYKELKIAKTLPGCDSK